MMTSTAYNRRNRCVISIIIINHILQSMIKAVISILTCMSMASNNKSGSECY